MSGSPGDVTLLLDAMRAGQPDAERQFFASLSVEETAAVLECVHRTVNRDWLRRQPGVEAPV